MLKTSRFVIIIVLFAVFGPLSGFAQQHTKIMGTVIDAQTNQPVPFVNIYFKGTEVQTTTDFDGKFSLDTKNATDSLSAQYMGYISQVKLIVKNKFQYIDFELEPVSFNLSEVVILPGVNPAEVILKKVIKNKEINNKDFWYNYKKNDGLRWVAKFFMGRLPT